MKLELVKAADPPPHRHLHVTVPPHVALYETEHKEDHYDEFIREVSVELQVTEYADDKDDDGTHKTIGSLAGIIVRHRCAQDGINMFDVADAHSGGAAEVSFYLTETNDHEFFDKFDVSAVYANVLLVEQVEWEGATTAEIRQFVRRSVEQFDV